MIGKRMYVHDYTRPGFYMITILTHEQTWRGTLMVSPSVKKNRAGSASACAACYGPASLPGRAGSQPAPMPKALSSEAGKVPARPGGCLERSNFELPIQ